MELNQDELGVNQCQEEYERLTLSIFAFMGKNGMKTQAIYDLLHDTLSRVRDFNDENYVDIMRLFK